MRYVFLLWVCPLLTGCLAFMPPDENPLHLEIDWRADFDAARAEAEESCKPLLVVTAAGDIAGFC